MKETKTQRGITLVALIITIIVLLILAGVAISMLAGDNGILRKLMLIKIAINYIKDYKESEDVLKNVSFIDKKSIIFVVGPEGGIDLGERDFFINSGFIPVSLGKNILRTETASLAFLSMLMYEYMKG